MRPKSRTDGVADGESDRNADEAEGGFTGNSASADRLFLRMCGRNGGSQKNEERSVHAQF
jgi:hypothetical protein